MKKDNNGNVYPSFTPVPLGCENKQAFVICSIDEPKYDSPQKPFSKFPCIRKYSKGRKKRTEMLQRENSENIGEMTQCYKQSNEKRAILTFLSSILMNYQYISLEYVFIQMKKKQQS